jgi:hypothetical protein
MIENFLKANEMLYKIDLVVVGFELKRAPPYFSRKGQKLDLGAVGAPPPLGRCIAMPLVRCQLVQQQV